GLDPAHARRDEGRAVGHLDGAVLMGGNEVDRGGDGVGLLRVDSPGGTHLLVGGKIAAGRVFDLFRLVGDQQHLAVLASREPLNRLDRVHQGNVGGGGGVPLATG